MDKRSIALIAGITILLAACAPASPQAATELPTATPSGPTATPFVVAPTLQPDPTATPTPQATETPQPSPTATSAAPTPLPAPTRIGAQPTTAAEATPATPDPEDTGITLEPNLGEPGDVTIVRGTAFVPGSAVDLRWAEPDGPAGDIYHQVVVEDDGSFEVGLVMPAAEDWPGGVPEDHDAIQLRASSEALPGYEYYANFTYVPRVGQTTLALAYVNDDFGYRVELPSGWTYSWAGDDTSDVRFESNAGTGSGFIRVVPGTDLDAVIETVVGQEFVGESYVSGDMSTGAYPGRQITVSSGEVVQFIPSGGRTYVLSFTNDYGQFAVSIAGSFCLL